MGLSDEKDREDFNRIWNDLNDLMKRWHGCNIDLNFALSVTLLHLLNDYQIGVPSGFGFEAFDRLVPGHKNAVVAIQKEKSERN